MKIRYLLLITGLAIVSCATSQVVGTLTPEAPEGHFEMGREYIPLSNAGLLVEMGFDGIYEQNLVFDVVVLNEREEPLTFDPSDFYYEILDSADAVTAVMEARYSVSPEKVFEYYDDALEDRETRKKLNSFLGFLEGGIGIIADFSAYMSTENPACIVDAVFNSVGTAGHYVSIDKAIDHEMEQISLEKEVVWEEILQKGELPPGKVVSGFVFFPLHAGDGYYMFSIPLEDQLFQFVYHQQRRQAE